jgi:phytoene synthase
MPPATNDKHVHDAMTPLMALIRQYDPDRFLAGLFVAPDKREAWFLLAAFNHELARAREVASQGMLALIRLQWWREVVEGARRRHDIAEPLGAALDSGVLDRAALLAMIEAREIEADDMVADRATFDAYVAASGGGFAVAAGRLLGAAEAELPRLRQLGAVYGIAGQMANFRSLARQGRCLLPEDMLAAHGLSGDDVRQSPDCAAPVLRELAAHGLALYRDAAGPLPRAILPAALPSVLARRDLGRGAHRRLLPDTLAVLFAAARGRV